MKTFREIYEAVGPVDSFRSFSKETRDWIEGQYNGGWYLSVSDLLREMGYDPPDWTRKEKQSIAKKLGLRVK